MRYCQIWLFFQNYLGVFDLFLWQLLAQETVVTADCCFKQIQVPRESCSVKVTLQWNATV